MQVYFSAYGISGIRRVLKQFDEAELSEYQRDILYHRLRLVEFWRTNGKNISLTARQFHTSRSYVRRLIYGKEKEGLPGLIPVWGIKTALVEKKLHSYNKIPWERLFLLMNLLC